MNSASEQSLAIVIDKAEYTINVVVLEMFSGATTLAGTIDTMSFPMYVPVEPAPMESFRLPIPAPVNGRMACWVDVSQVYSIPRVLV